MITNVVDETGNVTKYEFDTLDRLTKEINGDNITAYFYDLAGNRIQMRKFENAQVTNEVDYTLGLGNRLASWGEAGEAHYNLAGCLTNMVSDIDGRELNLDWNDKYQLTLVDVDDETSVSYDYNVLGQRVARAETVAGVITTEYYVHDGGNIIADLDEDKELLRSYSYAPGYDNIISMTSYGDSETNTYFYIRNHNNSVVALIDEVGNVAESYTYSAYGEIKVFDANGNELDESAFGNRYCFQGREIDWTTGLYNFRARWYDAETGRWLSRDPIGINGGLNQYVFCGNNPVMFLDPRGEFAFWGVVAAICITYAAIKYVIFLSRDSDEAKAQSHHKDDYLPDINDAIDAQVNGDYDVPLYRNAEMYKEVRKSVDNVMEVPPPGMSGTGPINIITGPTGAAATALTEGINLLNDAASENKDEDKDSGDDENFYDTY